MFVPKSANIKSKYNNTHIIRVKFLHKKSIFRDIEIPSSASLHALANWILIAFDMEEGHLFGFGDNPRSYWRSEIQYELDFELDERRDLRSTDTKIENVPFFQNPKDKMSFLYDFGEEWEFEVELKAFGFIENYRSPIILEKKGNRPGFSKGYYS